MLPRVTPLIVPNACLWDSYDVHTHWEDVGELAEENVRFKHEGSRITLRGVQPTLGTCKAISAATLQGLASSGEICDLIELFLVHEDNKTQHDISSKVHQVIQQYSTLFQEPASLPPHRKYEHHIPLLLGTTLVNMKPYRYNLIKRHKLKHK